MVAIQFSYYYDRWLDIIVGADASWTTYTGWHSYGIYAGLLRPTIYASSVSG